MTSVAGDDRSLWSNDVLVLAAQQRRAVDETMGARVNYDDQLSDEFHAASRT
ncbi:hypothetical protein [Mycolicibacterium sp. F2034L]|uniref:hypothetical protein n=1 Tax=Mycolicibacterium sp. F2034L TaxID=2926422 RepID=UPI001FF47CB6|nr:hypothetical protein [Mycolicibacterium sp. F2034L]MCK0177630.1 hypothetical protein [Mycolicibacterium sp. F2034L]